MKMRILQIAALILMLASCSKAKANELLMDRRSTEADLMLYNAICGNSVTLVKEAFEIGANPNYCKGDAGWYDSNPLDVLVENILDSYYLMDDLELYYDDQRYLEISNLGVLDLLLSKGADVHKRPYIWHIVVLWDNSRIADIKKTGDIYGHKRSEEEILKHIQIYIADANKLLEGFLKNGADPDKLGHKHQYSLDAIKENITDEKANVYFSIGTRAINEAIEKGILWESQVDLLLQYTKLDEESLKAAERSNDPIMIDKIRRLWEEQ